MVDVGGVGSLWDEDGGLRMRWGVRQATVAAEGCAWGGRQATVSSRRQCSVGSSWPQAPQAAVCLSFPTLEPEQTLDSVRHITRGSPSHAK